MTDIVERLIALANSLGGDDEDAIMAGVAEIERLTAERDLWKERTEQGSLIIEGNVAEIERLTALAQELEAELRKSAYSEGELQAEIKQLRALRVEWP